MYTIARYIHYDNSERLVLLRNEILSHHLNKFSKNTIQILNAPYIDERVYNAYKELNTMQLMDILEGHFDDDELHTFNPN